MKKILFILLVCFIKLNAYEYLITKDLSSRTYDRFYLDRSGKLVLKTEYLNDNRITYDSSDSIFFSTLDYLKFNNYWMIGRDAFNNLISGDAQFYNDMYVQKLQPWLNYLYNNNHFNSSSYIKYDNYELLYNSDGLAVESIVNGIWRGLYNGPDNSGYLYNEKDDLVYINGVSVSFFQKINDKLMKRFKINLESIFIKKIFYPLLILIFACVVFRTVIRMAVKAFLIRFYDNKIRRLEKRRENIENA